MLVSKIDYSSHVTGFIVLEIIIHFPLVCALKDVIVLEEQILLASFLILLGHSLRLDNQYLSSVLKEHFSRYNNLTMK